MGRSGTEKELEVDGRVEMKLGWDWSQGILKECVMLRIWSYQGNRKM